jgi:tRNA(Ser,Leu) C12 N-acetylase TAN1
MHKLLVTARDLYSARALKAFLRKLGFNPKATGFRAVLLLYLEPEKDIFDCASELARKCSYEIGRIVAALEEVDSTEPYLKEAAVRIASKYIRKDESFCFRLHKRGAHKITKPTPEVEHDIGSAIYEELTKKYNKAPKVVLKEPELTVVAEVLGEKTLLGITRKEWQTM